MLRKHFVILTTACLFSGTSLQVASAQNSIPLGSYEQTCGGSYVSGNTLYSACSSKSSSTRYAQLVSYQECRGDIANLDGFLTCPKGDADAPDGSYLYSCRDLVVRRNNLYATCQTNIGSWVNTNPTNLANFGSYRGDIVNIDGTLAYR